MFSGAGLCQSFAQNNSQFNFCSTIIGYSFFIPEYSSNVSLNDQIIKILSDTRLQILPKECLAHIKTVACGLTYLRCSITDGNSKNIKVELPCSSLCKAISPICDELLYSLGINFGCEHDYFGHSIVNSSVCNFPADEPLYTDVAASSEAYLFADSTSNGACTGIIENLNPSAIAYTLGLPPLQPSFVAQNEMEYVLRSELNALPSWISPQCRFAIREYLCTLKMASSRVYSMRSAFADNNISKLETQSFNLSSSALDYEFYLKEYPDYQICVAYRETCALYLKTYNTSAMLVPQCDAVASDGLAFFPKEDFIILNLTIKTSNNTTRPVKLISRPDLFVNSRDESGYRPTCPTGLSSLTTIYFLCF